MAEVDDQETNSGTARSTASPARSTSPAPRPRSARSTALPDPLTIDLTEIDRMDTVGAWIVYRTVRDRGAKVIGASRDEVSLLKQVGEFDKPARVVPDEPHNFIARPARAWRMGVGDAARPWSACSASSARP